MSFPLYKFPKRPILTKRKIKDYDVIASHPLYIDLRSRFSAREEVEREIEKEVEMRGYNAAEELTIKHSSSNGHHTYSGYARPVLVANKVTTDSGQESRRSEQVLRKHLATIRIVGREEARVAARRARITWAIIGAGVGFMAMTQVITWLAGGEWIWYEGGLVAMASVFIAKIVDRPFSAQKDARKVLANSDQILEQEMNRVEIPAI